MANSITQQAWYDLPRYYDLSVADETAAELAFVQAAVARFATIPVKQILEPACGTGRLAKALAKIGYRVTAFDLNPQMLAFAKAATQQQATRPKFQLGDMSQFSLPRPVDAAVCLLDSFRHLLSESAARSHLQCVAQAVKPGGVYLLGLHLLPPDASLECTERWTNQSGRTRVSTTLRVLTSSRRTRLERIRISLLIRQGNTEQRIRDEFDLRLYTAAQLRSLLQSVPQWELVAVTDYWYDLEQLFELDNEMSDTVLILRRKEN